MAKSKSMQECIETCWECRNECQKMLYNHCVEEGGEHVEPSHVRLMADCIEICQTSADFMVRNSDLHSAVCGACAEVCEACAESCEAIGDDAMNACAEVCRRCAESCRQMSEMRQAA